ncbi:PLP-dependent aminotransferase family protein [Brevibacillus nitrificans]|uniref:PLP-dependent aminotransferase family protein n=1 Tax=Brevibacillus nitrificans TaxID=651560 RepID=A0A3M8CZQ5_9BACL|nr:PLP-dependent aminotransferase family protein [Brevibacillus nitrificans]RNB80385.1 PLP-dependent aminotransferase family protein [Brevibacillus nitrificans]
MHKYMSLQNELERLIEGDTYRDGDKLPSIRELSRQYQCSMSTIIRTLAELEKRHLIYSVDKSGYYVVKKHHASHSPLSPFTDFATSAPDPDVFPYLDFQHCINKAIETYKNDLFVYGTAQGLPTLIPVLQKLLANHQVFAQPPHIVVTSGVQQALALLATIPFPNGKTNILIEQPGYHLLIEYLETHKLPVMGIKRTGAGLDLDELEQLFHRESIKFFYTMPRFHSPLGTTYSRQDKQAIVELARKYDVYLVEDDHLADLEQDSKADPLFSYDRSGHVIYLKSFSKIIFPGLRLGVAVIPESLTDIFNRFKKLLDIDSSMLSQAALEIYVKSGMFDRHKQKIRTSYDRRARLLTDSLIREQARTDGLFRFPMMKHPGIHTHLVLNERLSVPRLVPVLKKQFILIESIDRHYLSDFPRDNILKLNASTVKEERIEQAVEQLVEVLSKAQR